MRLLYGMAYGVATAILAVGCGLGGSKASSDCAVAVQYRAAEYREVGFSEEPTSKLGSAELAACDDVGVASSGSTFDDAERVDVLSFDGFSPSEVIGLHQSDYTRILVVTSIASSRKQQLIDALNDS